MIKLFEESELGSRCIHIYCIFFGSPFPEFQAPSCPAAELNKERYKTKKKEIREARDDDEGLRG